MVSNYHALPQSTMMIAVFVVVFIVAIVALFGLSVFRSFKNRRLSPKDESCSVSRCWRRQLPSSSFDQTLTISDKNRLISSHQSSRVIKNSFSWPEAILLNEQQQQTHRNFSGKDESSPTLSSASLSTSSTLEQIIEPASLTFSLRWNEQNKSLFIRVINGRNLISTRRHQSLDSIDSYIKLELMSKDETEQFPVMRTHIVKKNPHPVFDELFEFSNLDPSGENNYSLRLTVLTYDTFTRDEILGEVLFEIENLDEFQSAESIFTRDMTPRRLQLANQSLGQLLISLCYQSADSNITLILLKASNLPRLDSRRLINPYVKIYMFYKGQRLIKRRSSIKRTTQNPVYNESFSFQIPENDISNIHFDLILFDYDRHIKHEPIGMTSIGTSNDESTSFWSDACNRKSVKQIAQWYQLKPLDKFNF